ncbi:hypothetical protein [Streptomyces sp. NPDC057616]|uniref:hypothetical protein n=1 Tax=Streptomyces sp. NPDC057616 TaxID=3346183 RepID=UPI00369C3E9D
MGFFASQCLVWRDVTFMDPAEAEAVAGQVVELLGADARRWSNGHDGLLAGTDGHRFAVLIQVGED